MILVFVLIAVCLVTLVIVFLSSLASVPKVDEYGDPRMSVSDKVKANKKKYIAYIIVLSTILALLLGYAVADKIIFETKKNFTVEEVKFTTEKIYKKVMGFDSWIQVRFWSTKRDGDLRDTELFENVDTALLNQQNFYICTSGGESWAIRHFEPTEIAATFECLLYFENKELPGELIGILNYQNTGAQLHPIENVSFISNVDLEQLRTEVDIDGLSRKKAAEKLAERWIEIHNYVKG